MLFIRHIALMVATGFLTACSVGPTYVAPTPNVSEAFFAPLPHNGELSNLKTWWQQFDDPLIAELIIQAQEHSPTLTQALARINQARANLGEARGGQYPSLDLNAAAKRSKDGASLDGITSGISSTKTLGADASWEIDLFGGRRKASDAAKARLSARQADWHDSRVSLAAEVANALVNYRSCTQIVKILQEDLNSRTQTQQLIKLKIKAGFSAPADGVLIDASTADARQRLVAQNAQCDLIIKELVALTDLPEKELRNKIGKKVALPRPREFVVNSVPAQIISQRPDIASAERELAAASADINVAEANRYPKITLLGSIGTARLSADGIQTESGTWSFGPSISLPIFDGGRRKALAEATQARYEEMDAIYRQKVRFAVREVEQALVRLDATVKREQDALSSVENYERFLKASENSYKNGNSNLLDLEEARRTLLSARQVVVTIQSERVAAWISLYKAVGGGWDKQFAASNP